MMAQRRNVVREMRSGMASAAGGEAAELDLSDEALDKPLKQMALFDNSVAHKT